MRRISPLARVYVSALCGRALYVHAPMEGGAMYFGFEQFREKGLVGKLIAKFWFQRPAHAELVALRCISDFKIVGGLRSGWWLDLPPSEVVAKINTIAGQLGARFQTQAEIEADAKKVVAEITRQVAAARSNGGLKDVNTEYKNYRLAQIEKSEPAIPYSAYLTNFTRLLVLRAAEKSLAG